MSATMPLFRADPYRREAEATVLSASPEGIVLDASLFYPTGGGQQGDSGTLFWDGGETPIETTRKDGEAIVAIPLPYAKLPLSGTTVRQVIDWENRHRMMRIHTALHLLSVVVPLPVTGGQITPEKGRLDFDMPDAPEDRDAIEARLNALILQDYPVAEDWITDAELEANPGLVKTMSVKPPMGSGRVRLVRIGSVDAPVDLQPCGGTHVRSTAEIGPISLGKIEKKGRQNRRISLHLGAA
ncbi:alanyl-tRNA editing protein [Halovulum dunhuangense]|uniref:Alanine--tRNA ligase n=1 Tax=Halovulum dunhuangense TaxID=1505036 RepID=A0A849L187_9RHOB|nr:alanyl-tRNA editing protein [Halovulum dunhuangense]NNU80058.1 alanyl-tRNA editing protein [Halovulum dunhuangense]